MYRNSVFRTYSGPLRVNGEIMINASMKKSHLLSEIQRICDSGYLYRFSGLIGYWPTLDEVPINDYYVSNEDDYSENPYEYYVLNDDPLSHEVCEVFSADPMKRLTQLPNHMITPYSTSPDTIRKYQSTRYRPY